MSDSIQESYISLRAWVLAGGGRRGVNLRALYESIASVPDESHLLGGE